MYKLLIFSIGFIFLLPLFFPYYGRAVTDSLPPSDEFFQLSGELFKQNKKAAAKQFQLFIKRYPKDEKVPEAEFMIGECLLNLEPTSLEALKKFQRVLNKYTSNRQTESAALRIAEIYYNRKEYLKSLKCLEKMESKYPKGYIQYEIQLLKAKCCFVLKRYLETESILSHLLLEQPVYKEDKRFNYIFGLINYQLEKYELALENLEKVNSPESLSFSSEALLKMEKPLLAIEKLKELISNYQENTLQERANFLIGEAFFLAKDYNSTIHSYERFLQLYPQSSLREAAIYKIGCSYLEKGDYLQARSNFQSVLQLKSQSEFAPPAIYLIGESFVREKRFKESCFAYGDMVNSYPDNFYTPNAQYKLGWCYFNLRNFPQTKIALIQFQHLFSNHSLLPQIQFLLGNTMGELTLYSEASGAYQRVIDQTQEIELKEAALSLMSRANYLSQNYTSLISGCRYLLNQFPPNTNSWRMITYLVSRF